MENSICKLFNIQYPMVQAGMVWCSPWQLAAAVSNAGGLGIIGAGSMHPDILREHIQKCKKATYKNFGVNIPLLYPQIDDLLEIIVQEKVPIVITSAGNPKKYTSWLKQHRIIVTHVVSSAKFAKKAEEAGCDAIVAEGFEAGGHNGREETTTMCLIPQVVNSVKVPVIAAGGISSGRSMAAAFALGASGVQIGSRFVASVESSANQLFKQMVLNANEGETKLTLKEITPVRLLNSPFSKLVAESYEKGFSIENLKELLGKGRAKKGMFEGNLEEGEFEIGQVSALIDNILPSKQIVEEIMNEFHTISRYLGSLKF